MVMLYQSIFLNHKLFSRHRLFLEQRSLNVLKKLGDGVWPDVLFGRRDSSPIVCVFQQFMGLKGNVK